MQKITTATNRRLHGLLNKANVGDLKPMLVAQFSCIKAESSKDLLESEAINLCRHLEKQLAPKAPAEPLPPHLNPDRDDVMRKKIFSLCRSMGYIYGYTEADKAINRSIVYGLVERKGKFKKPLNKHSHTELVELVSQFESWAKHNDKAKAAKEVKALMAELNLEKV
jgi:hypothetical protein